MNYKKIVYYRKKRKISQQELAEQLNIDQETLVEWEFGLSEPTDVEVRTLSRILRVSLKELEHNTFTKDPSYTEDPFATPTKPVTFDVTTTNDIFQGNLSADEKVLWQGRPNENKYFSKSDIFTLPFGIIWIMIIASSLPMIMNNMPRMSIFQFPFLAIGFWLVFGRYIYIKKMKKHTYYAITNKRVLIVNMEKERREMFVNLHDVLSTHVEYDAKGIGTISFQVFGFDHSQNLKLNMGMFKAGPSFIHIDDCPKVHQMIQNLLDNIKQKRAA